MAFNAKNLSYEKQEPAFLRKLRGEYGGGSSNISIARPRRPKNEEDDDGPTYVDEESNEVFSKKEYEALVNSEDPEKQAQDWQDSKDRPAVNPTSGEPGPSDNEIAKEKQKIAEVGEPKKRKNAKIIGDGVQERIEADGDMKDDAEKKPKAKSKKKKIKLSFDEPADG